MENFSTLNLNCGNIMMPENNIIMVIWALNTLEGRYLGHGYTVVGLSLTIPPPPSFFKFLVVTWVIRPNNSNKGNKAQ